MTLSQATLTVYGESSTLFQQSVPTEDQNGNSRYKQKEDYTSYIYFLPFLKLIFYDLISKRT